MILLRDYMNILPAGPQEAYVPTGDMGGMEEAWPITATLERRMNPKSEEGETYAKLDRALSELDRVAPRLYNAVLAVYLHPEAGHSDLEFLRRQGAVSGDSELCDLVARVDKAIDWIATQLEDETLYVKFPNNAPGPMQGTAMDEKHTELYAVFKRYINQGIKFSQALKHAAMNQGYHKEHARKVIKARLDNEQ